MGNFGVWGNGEELVIATSAEDARNRLIAETGLSAEEADGDGSWRRLDDDKPLSIVQDEPGLPKVTKTAAEWVASEPPGPLASTEY